MRVAVAAAVLALTVGAAQAAGAGPAAPSAFSWTGFYLGANGGYGWFDAQQKPPFGYPEYGVDTDGWVGGGQIGANWQTGRLVLGIEGDGDWSSIRGSIVPDPQHNSATRTSVDIDGMATIRGRVGLAFDRALVYATGGAAFAHAKATVTNFTGNGDDRSDSEMNTGWLVGFGGEYALTNHFVIGAEYLHYDFGDKTYAFTNPDFPIPDYRTLTAEGSSTGDMVRVRASYLFH
jgi:outer membrane immunogenic protein